VIVPIDDSLIVRCRPLLQLQVRRLQLSEQFLRRHDSSDLVQEALTRAVSRAEQYRGGSDGEAIRWLQRILQTVVLNKLEEACALVRDYDREVSLEASLAESTSRMESFLAAAGPSPAERVERTELLILLAEAINRLPDDQRDVVNLRDMHGYRVAEIARMLDKTEKSVAGLLLRGRLELRAFAQKIGLSPHDD
jgi:RNA polymerase sigma-70 factor (ECF subfamily)